MPKYKIHAPDGRSMVVSGATPPDEESIKALFGAVPPKSELPQMRPMQEGVSIPQDPKTPAEAFERMFLPPGSRGSAPVADEPIGDADIAAIIRGLGITALPAAAPSVAGAGLVHAAKTLLPAIPAMHVVGAGGRAIGEKVGLPETGQVVGETVGGIGAGSVANKVQRALAARAAQPPPPAPVPPPPPPVAPVAPAAPAAPAEGGIGAIVDQMKPEAVKLMYDLLGRRLGSMTGIPGATLLGGRIGRFVHNIVNKGTAGRTPSAPTGPTLPEGLTEADIKGLMQTLGGVSRETAIQVASSKGLGGKGAVTAPAPAPGPRPLSKEAKEAIDAAVARGRAATGGVPSTPPVEPVPVTPTPVVPPKAPKPNKVKTAAVKTVAARGRKSTGAVGGSPDVKAAVAEATAAVSGNKLPAAVVQARDSLPPVPKDHTRMWRVEGASAVEAGGAGGKKGGDWFEENLGAYATSGTKPGDVRYVDVPNSRLSQLKADPNATEVQLPSGYVARSAALTPIKPTVPPAGAGTAPVTKVQAPPAAPPAGEPTAPAPKPNVVKAAVAKKKTPKAAAKELTDAGAKLGPGFGHRNTKETVRISDKTVGAAPPAEPRGELKRFYNVGDKLPDGSKVLEVDSSGSILMKSKPPGPAKPAETFVPKELSTKAPAPAKEAVETGPAVNAPVKDLRPPTESKPAKRTPLPVAPLTAKELVIKRAPITSSAFKGYGYDAKSKVLEVEHADGKVYRYNDIELTPEDLATIDKAESKGRALGALIRLKPSTPRRISAFTPRRPERNA